MKYLKSYNESLRDKMTPISDEKIQELIDNLGFELYGVDLEEKGNFGQDLVDVYAAKDENLIFKLGQIRTIKDLVIFYPDFRRIESGILATYQKVDDLRPLDVDEKTNVILQLNQDKKMGGLMDDSTPYIVIVKKFINR